MKNDVSWWYTHLCVHNHSPSMHVSLSALRGSALCHRGNKQQQLSMMGLIKHSASVLQPAVYCSLDQSRPKRSRQRLAVAMNTSCLFSNECQGETRGESRLHLQYVTLPLCSSHSLSSVMLFELRFS